MKKAQIISAVILALVMGWGSGWLNLAQPCKAQPQLTNAFVLTRAISWWGRADADFVDTVDFYADVLSGTTELTVSIYDGDEDLRMVIEDTTGTLLYDNLPGSAAQGDGERFKTNGWDNITLTVKEVSTYHITLSSLSGSPKSDEYRNGNIFWIDVATQILYSRMLQFIDWQDAKIWVMVPRGVSEFILYTYEMEDRGSIYITSPDGLRYGPFQASGQREWSDIAMPTGGRGGFWNIEFRDIDGAGMYLAAAEALETPLELYVNSMMVRPGRPPGPSL